ncbi:MAG TPA: hypothetical protein VFH68_22485 [Polyangia bacterium]|nr:hypothetical protein [Polyangia bacterium]
MGDPEAEGPEAAPVARDDWAFEAFQALPGFCTLVKRSPTLDGQLPLRAAQHCSPVFEGNEAGVQICLAQPMTLSRGRRGLHVDMTPPALDQTQRQTRLAVRALVSQGLLAADGYWHRLLGEDAMPARGNRIFLWTGWLVRPAPGVALRVSAAFNRRSRIAVVDHAIADGSAFTPLVLEIDGRALRDQPTWIDEEIGCALPVAASSTMTLASIRQSPEVVRDFESFFDAHYFELKRSKPTGKYRRLVREPAAAPAATCEARVYTAGPAIHEIAWLRRFHGPGGISSRPPAGVALPACTVRNVGRIEADWDGQAFTRERKDLAVALRALARDWRAAGGSTTGDGYEFLSGYMFAPGRDEPYWLLQPWVFAVTPPGWSVVADGLPAGGSDGMRGIIRTDQFHSVAMVYRLYTPGRITVRAGAAVLKFFPIPHRLQSAPVRLVDQVI